MKIQTHYFAEASRNHTENVIEVVRKHLNSQSTLVKIIVATTGGATGLAFAKAFKDKNVIVVTHEWGFSEPNNNEIDPKKREEIIELGAEVLTSSHAFAGVGRSVRKLYGTWTVTELFAVVYRTFGQGTKVCAEIAMMAADAGLVRVDQDVVCVGGTGRGADTAWLVQPANSSRFPEIRMRACLCKPLEF